MTLFEYLALITSQHADKPRYTATVSAALAPLVGIQDTTKSLPQAFDIDEAIGAQLDTIGLWVGRSRIVDVPLSGVYFTWDSAALGWDFAAWRGPYDPTTGMVSLPDDAYRKLLKAKIAANNWRGSIPDAYAVWESIYTDSKIVIQDWQDMSMSLAILGGTLSAIDQALLIGGYIPLKPAGVRINFYMVPGTADSKMFAWDTQSAELGGWDEAAWGVELTPTPGPEFREPVTVDGFLVTIDGEAVTL